MHAFAAHMCAPLWLWRAINTLYIALCWSTKLLLNASIHSFVQRVLWQVLRINSGGSIAAVSKAAVVRDRRAVGCHKSLHPHMLHEPLSFISAAEMV